ncbi:MAG TPA: dipeptide epimerase [Polyangiaceae bacterium]|jgi:L-alanine-DL-glutamate epimerase-like enolase superfamily enzyme|nr:dipeptide epimerase [Polyangiaceae bacterium]
MTKTAQARIQSIEARPLSAPLLEPFVIASARVDTTLSVHVAATLSAEGGGGLVESAVEGLGEAASLPPVTREDQPEALATIQRAASALAGLTLPLPDPSALRGPDKTRAVEPLFSAIDAALTAVVPSSPVARAGLETAILDAVARMLGLPVRALLGGDPGPIELVTDITIPIGDPPHMADLARAWRDQGFSLFKVKVGKDLDHDIEALEGIARAVPGAALRIDANAGFTSAEAIAFARELERRKIPIECFEQPCPTDDIEAMAEVTRAIAIPVVADESVKTLADLDRVIAAKAASGVNLKLAKSGGPLAAVAIGRAALAAGMDLMVGGMVETRLGMTAAAHVAAALGGARFIDLDTAWLLAEDPYEGGYRAQGPHYTLDPEPGLGVRVATRK